MKTQNLAFSAIGTHWDIQFGQEVPADTLAVLKQQIQTRTAAFDKAYSRFRADSLVTAMSKRAGAYELPDDGFALLQFYERLYRATDGLVTPLIGQVMADAGYDAAYSFEQKTPLKQPPRWEDVMSYDGNHLEIKEPVLLDFGAAGKGYLVDSIGQVIQAAGIASFVIDASGDVLHRAATEQEIEIGLENPHDVSEVIGITKLGNKSLCASSGSRRKWRNFHHIINPRTLRPADRVIATWVIADDTMTADGLATALFFASAAELSKKFSFSYAVLNQDMSLVHSPAFPLTLFEAVHE